MPRLKWTPMFEWWMVGHGSRNGHQKSRCWKEIGLRAQSIFTILNAIIIMIWRDMYDHLITWRIFTLAMYHGCFTPTPKFTRKVGHEHDVDLLISSHWLCFVFYKNLVQKENIIRFKSRFPAFPYAILEIYFIIFDVLKTIFWSEWPRSSPL